MAGARLEAGAAILCPWGEGAGRRDSPAPQPPATGHSRRQTREGSGVQLPELSWRPGPRVGLRSGWRGRVSGRSAPARRSGSRVSPGDAGTLTERSCPGPGSSAVWGRCGSPCLAGNAGGQRPGLHAACAKCLLPCLAAVAGGGWSDQPGLSPVAEPSTERTAPGHASRQRPAPEAPTTRTCLRAPVPPPGPRLDAWQSPRRPAGPWAPQGGPAGPTGTSTRLQGPGGQGSVQGATEPPPPPRQL